tara:strand:+ start:313 stop:531 length:219 start_codon:yes stop_codon:yes gene_type:complete
MNIKEYCKDRRLEMVTENQTLEKRKKEITSQGQMLQAQLNQTNLTLGKLEVELELLDKIEASLNGAKEAEKC